MQLRHPTNSATLRPASTKRSGAVASPRGHEGHGPVPQPSGRVAALHQCCPASAGGWRVLRARPRTTSPEDVPLRGSAAWMPQPSKATACGFPASPTRKSLGALKIPGSGEQHVIPAQQGCICTQWLLVPEAKPQRIAICLHDRGRLPSFSQHHIHPNPRLAPFPAELTRTQRVRPLGALLQSNFRV